MTPFDQVASSCDDQLLVEGPAIRHEQRLHKRYTANLHEQRLQLLISLLSPRHLSP
jgi:hypothetical protein